MTAYTFTLTFRLPSADTNPEDYLDALYEAGCDDATVGSGKRGMIGLEFTRRAPSAAEALESGVEAVYTAIPGAELMEAGADLVGLSDVADVVGCSRQAMRKYLTGETQGCGAFPSPAHTGNPSLWHLAEIALWLEQNTRFRIPRETIDVAKETARLNLTVQERRVRRILQVA